MEYIITTQLSDSQIQELVNYSTSDSVLAKWTSDTSRFRSEEATNIWLQTNPEYIVLSDHEDSLLGIAWLQSKPIPEYAMLHSDLEVGTQYEKTSGIRLYGSARGKGLSKWFYTKLFEQFHSPHVWVQVSDDNSASKRLHEKMGFIQVSKPDDHNKIILVRDSHNN